MIDMLLRVYAGFSAVAAEPIAVSGSPAECAAALRPVIAAGAELILFTPLFDQRAQMHRLADEVIPLLMDG